MKKILTIISVIVAVFSLIILIADKGNCSFIYFICSKILAALCLVISSQVFLKLNPSIKDEEI